MPTAEGPTGAGFWRCGQCGTPNPWTLYLTACVGCGAPRPAPGFESRADAAVAVPRAKPRLRSPRLMVAVAGYGLVLMAACLLERAIGDGWWPGMVLSMAPRGVFLLPLVPLTVWAWRARRATIGGVILAEALFVAGPLMGFVVPWGRLGAGAGGATIRVMTFNRGGGRIDADRFLRYLDRHKIDVICFQEYNPDPPLDRMLEERSWHRDKSRAIASRYPIAEELPRSAEINENDRHYTAVLYRARIQGPDGRAFVVGSLHLPTSRYAFQRLFQLDPSWMAPYIGWWGREFARMFELLGESGDVPVLVGGDFNAGPEATALEGLLGSGAYRSAFDEAGWGWGYTRPAAFPWVRIDHILAGPEWTIRSAWVGPDFGSDHRSLVAEVALPAKP